MLNIYQFLEWCLTSSFLILLVLLLRLITKRWISPVLRYSLWLLVLLRLLLPFNPLESIFSIMNPAETLIDSSNVIRPIIDLTYHIGPSFYYDSNYILHYQPLVTSWRYMIFGIWCYGMFVVANSVILNNWTLWRKLKIHREPHFDHTDPLRPRLYRLKGLASPCLFGLRHPSIYLNAAAFEDPTILEHAMAHEKAHYRHGDHIWSVLRLLVLILHWYKLIAYVALALHWFNPLVWIACAISKQDGEAAADDLAIRCLGDDNRLAYGQTLLRLVSPRAHSFSILSISTTMVSSMISSKRALRKRILSIARKPRTTRLSATIVSLLMLASILCTFTGAKASTWFDPETTSTPVVVQQKPKTPLCNSLREKMLTHCYAYTSTDITESFLEWIDYDRSLFEDICVYQFEDGSLLGAAEIKETKAGDLGSPIRTMLQDYASQNSMNSHINTGHYQIHFAIYQRGLNSLSALLDSIVNELH